MTNNKMTNNKMTNNMMVFYQLMHPVHELYFFLQVCASQVCALRHATLVAIKVFSNRAFFQRSLHQLT